MGTDKRDTKAILNILAFTQSSQYRKGVCQGIGYLFASSAIRSFNKKEGKLDFKEFNKACMNDMGFIIPYQDKGHDTTELRYSNNSKFIVKKELIADWEELDKTKKLKIINQNIDLHNNLCISVCRSKEAEIGHLISIVKIKKDQYLVLDPNVFDDTSDELVSEVYLYDNHNIQNKREKGKLPIINNKDLRDMILQLKIYNIQVFEEIEDNQIIKDIQEELDGYNGYSHSTYLDKMLDSFIKKKNESNQDKYFMYTHEYTHDIDRGNTILNNTIFYIFLHTLPMIFLLEITLLGIVSIAIAKYALIPSSDLKNHINHETDESYSKEHYDDETDESYSKEHYDDDNQLDVIG